MNKIFKTNLIAFAAVVAIPVAVSTYFNVRTYFDAKRIHNTNTESHERIQDILADIEKLKSE